MNHVILQRVKTYMLFYNHHIHYTHSLNSLTTAVSYIIYEVHNNFMNNSILQGKSIPCQGSGVRGHRVCLSQPLIMSFKHLIALQLNFCTMATLGTEESGHCKQMAIVERF